MLFGKKEKTKDREAFAGKHVLVVGAGKSGIGSVRLLTLARAVPILLEQNENRRMEEIRESLPYDVRDHLQIIIGELPAHMFRAFDAAVLSPGVPIDSPLVLRLKEEKVPVLSEVELAYRFMKGTLVAITGTNGKTTTTTLVGEILKALWPHGANEVFVVGNIGESFAAHAMETGENSVTVAEISSFQLEAVDQFHANVSCILNITPDHLDRHYTMENYAAVKERIANRQGGRKKKGARADFCILNYDDPLTRAFGEKRCNCAVMFFSSKAKIDYMWPGFVMDGDMIRWMAGSPGEGDILRFSECRLKGTCNAENVMAALGIVMALGIEPERAVHVIREFRPVAHRIEYIATKHGVEWYNDSKATNPDSAIQGIRAMDRPVLLIGGGYDKHADYDAWTACFPGRVKQLVLVGETAQTIADSAERNGFTDIVFPESFEEALRYCMQNAQPGDAVLLSPACASWGMFKNYEERGDRFRDFVNGTEA